MKRRGYRAHPVSIPLTAIRNHWSLKEVSSIERDPATLQVDNAGLHIGDSAFTGESRILLKALFHKISDRNPLAVLGSGLHRLMVNSKGGSSKVGGQRINDAMPRLIAASITP